MLGPASVVPPRRFVCQQPSVLPGTGTCAAGCWGDWGVPAQPGPLPMGPSPLFCCNKEKASLHCSVLRGKRPASGHMGAHLAARTRASYVHLQALSREGIPVHLPAHAPVCVNPDSQSISISACCARIRPWLPTCAGPHGRVAIPACAPPAAYLLHPWLRTCAARGQGCGSAAVAARSGPCRL